MVMLWKQQGRLKGCEGNKFNDTIRNQRRFRAHRHDVAQTGARATRLRAVPSHDRGHREWRGTGSALEFCAGRHTRLRRPLWQETAEAYPDAKIILSTRSAESWYSSISETILATVWAPDTWPPQATEWFKMVTKVLERSFGGAKDKDSLIAAFNAHEAEVKATIPAERLLVHSAKDGWEPLCAFLGKPVPAEPYPRTNSKEEFFQHMTKADNM